MVRCRKRIVGGMPRWRQRSWVMAACDTLPTCSSANPTRFGTAHKTSNNCRRTRPRGASEKKGGRKPASVAQPELLPAVEAVIQHDTAGSPVDPKIRWTNRSAVDLAQELQEQGFQIGPDALRRILFDELGLSRRQAYKDESACHFPFRDKQFRYIARQRARYERRDWPVISIDTKKKEILGDFFDTGQAS